MRNKLLAGITAAAILAGAPAFAGSAPDIIWSRTGLGGYAYAAAVDSSGNVFVTGKTPTISAIDMQTVKYDANGNEKWITTYDSGGVDRGFGIAVSPLGDVYAVGQGDAAGAPKWNIVKYDTAGAFQWAIAPTSPGTYDIPYGVAVAPTGTISVAGSARLAGLDNIRTLRYDSLKNVLTDVPYNNGGICIGYSVAVDKEGNTYVGGSRSNGAGYDYYLVKYDSTGAFVWDGAWDWESWDEIRGIAVDLSGSVYVTGYSWNGSAGTVRTMKYGSAGGTVWMASYGVGLNDEGTAIAIDSLNNAYVVGFTGTDTGKDFLVLKYDRGGALCWVKSFGSSYDDELHGAAMGPDDNLVVAGFTETVPASVIGYYRTMKIHTAASPAESTTLEVDSGKILAAPNSLDLSSPLSEAVFQVSGNPGGEVDLRLYDSAGRLAGTAKVFLDGLGRGRISYGRDGWGGRKPVPGAYWVAASGGGVKGKKLFFVIAGRK
jgi:hypothetical protein